MMNRILIAVSALVFASGAQAAAGGASLEHAQTELGNTAALQRGARAFVNYCLGCHSAQYMRYSRLTEDLDLSEEQVEQYLILDPDQKVGDLMTSSMPADLAEQWFGAAPPDLSVVARSRGVDWLYTFLKSFYADPSRPSGWNNTVFENTSMPHVLWQLQGVQTLAHEDTAADAEAAGQGAHGDAGPTFQVAKAGTMSAEEYERFVTDLVTYLEYMGEPAKLKRESIGVWVLLYLVVFTFLAWLLKLEFWRDVH